MADERRSKGSGTVFLRKQRGTWCCRWPIPGGRPVTRKVRSRQDGLRRLTRVEDYEDDGLDRMEAIRKAMGEPEPVGNQSRFGALVARYLDHLEQAGKRTPRNLAAERSKGNYVTEAALGDAAPARIDRAAVARWAESLLTDKKLSGKTVNRALSLASRAWSYGQDHGYAPEGRNPFRQVDRHPEPPIDKDPLAVDEVEKLIAVAPRDIRPLLTAGINTGARAGELMGLTWADVDLKAGHLTIRASREKTARGRQVPLTDELATLLRGMRRTRPASVYVFLRADGRPWTHKTKDARIRKALNAAKGKIPEHKRGAFTFKGLRDSVVTALLARGVPWPVVGRIVGHGTPQTTMRYLGVMLEDQRAGLAKLRAIGG